MFTGMLLGFLLRRQELRWIHKVVTILIWVLLFLLGIEVGSNREIITGLHTLELEAIAITFAGVTGSVLGAWALWYLLYKRKKESDMRGSVNQNGGSEGYAPRGGNRK